MSPRTPLDAAREAVERYDPDRSALVAPALYVGLDAVAGRAVYGRRRRAWRALEDKILVDAFWDRAGVARAPSLVVEADPDALRVAARRLDRGSGTVWAADARSGWHGGGERTRWVRPGDDPASVIDELCRGSDRVRVMPFLEGVPCSIHGLVFADHVAALRPVESVTLRRPGSPAFRYGGCATFWDPEPRDRDAMRDVARRVGARLRAEVGFRGTFTVDGVLTAEGFRPTELNPRFGAGMGPIVKGLPDLPLYFVHLAVSQGEAWDFAPRALERVLIEAADGTRGGGARGMDATRIDTNRSFALVQQPDGSYRESSGDEPSDATLHAGPAPLGCFVRFDLDPERTPRGPSVAPRAVRALEFADRVLGTRFGACEPCPPVP